MIGVIDVEIQAQNPEAPLYPLKAFVGSPSSLRVCNVPERIGKWRLTRVYVLVSYPDGRALWTECVPNTAYRADGIWVCTVDGCDTPGTSENGYAVYADGTDENGKPVAGYILGQGDVEVMEADGTVAPREKSVYVHLLSAFPLSGCPDGNMAPFEGGYGIMQGGEVRPLGAAGGGEDIPKNVDSPTTMRATANGNWEYQDGNSNPVFKIDEYGVTVSKRLDIYGELYYQNQALSDYVEGKDSALSVALGQEASAYTDEKVGEVHSNLTAYADEAAWNAESNANAYTDQHLSAYLPLSGGTMDGNIGWDYNGLGGPVLAGAETPAMLKVGTTYPGLSAKAALLDLQRIGGDQATIAYIDDLSAYLPLSGGNMTGNISLNNGSVKIEYNNGLVIRDYDNNLVWYFNPEGSLNPTDLDVIKRQDLNEALGDISALIHES